VAPAPARGRGPRHPAAESCRGGDLIRKSVSYLAGGSQRNLAQLGSDRRSRTSSPAVRRAADGVVAGMSRFFPRMLVSALVEQALAPEVLTGWAAREALAARADTLALRDLLTRTGQAVVRARAQPCLPAALTAQMAASPDQLEPWPAPWPGCRTPTRAWSSCCRREPSTASRCGNAPGLPDEQWFSILTRKLLRRGSSEPQEDLENRIAAFTIGYNKTAHPRKWRYDADADHARYLAPHPDKKPSPKPHSYDRT
jgi:hypothetical protein